MLHASYNFERSVILTFVKYHCNEPATFKSLIDGHLGGLCYIQPITAVTHTARSLELIIVLIL